MGCSVSSPLEPDGALKGKVLLPPSLIYPNICSDTCGSTTTATQSVSSAMDRVIASQTGAIVRNNNSVNENQIDASHFSLTEAPTIGVGGFGLVRLACKISPGADYMSVFAIKTISKKSVLARASGTAAVFNELQCLKLLATVESPFICNIQYAFQDERYLFLCMNYCSGGDLRYNLKHQPQHRFPESVCRFYIAQCLLAVDACHSVHILHRDVKPENLILDANGYIKLTDFGVSKYYDSDLEMECKSTSGTHGYMAPEIYAKHHVHGRAVDYFAVGVTLHELCLGQRPFEASSIRQYPSIALARAAQMQQHSHAHGHSHAHALSASGSTFGFATISRTDNSSGASSVLSAGASAGERERERERERDRERERKRWQCEEDQLRNVGLSLDLLRSATFLSAQCKDMIVGLLAFQPEARIGSQGIKAVKKHAWFQSFDWSALKRQSAQAPALHSTMRLRFDSRDFNANSIREHLACLPCSLEEEEQFKDYHHNILLPVPAPFPLSEGEGEGESDSL
jgi:serine/threonine protein kinase